jgi:hypothetical protein
VAVAERAEAAERQIIGSGGLDTTDK